MKKKSLIKLSIFIDVSLIKGLMVQHLRLWYNEFNNPRIVNPNDDMQGSYLGEFDNNQIEENLNEIGALL